MKFSVDGQELTLTQYRKLRAFDALLSVVKAAANLEDDEESLWRVREVARKALFQWKGNRR
jgi:hypothetical protein